MARGVNCELNCMVTVNTFVADTFEQHESGKTLTIDRLHDMLTEQGFEQGAELRHAIRRKLYVLSQQNKIQRVSRATYARVE